ncbi:MAG: hypothetical protein GX958_02565 [Desulfitobacterium sp.]|nr:hypothetical protein [Desulfitobacterium sp.]
MLRSVAVIEMQITSSMFFFQLEKELDFYSEYKRLSSITFKRIRYYRDYLEGETLFLVDCSNGIPNLAGLSSCVFLFYNLNLDSDVTPERGTLTFENLIPEDCDYCVLREGIDSLELMEKILEVWTKLMEWDSQLKDALQNKSPLQDVLQLGHNIIQRPYSLIDRNFSVIYMTEEFLEAIGDGEDLKNEESLQYLPSDKVQELLMDEEFHQAEEKRGLFYYYTNYEEEPFICINIFSEERYLARLFSPVYPSHRDVEVGEKELFRHFANYVSKAYMSYTDDVLVRHQKDVLHNLVRRILTSSEQEKIFIGNALEVYGWKKDDTYVLLKLNFFMDEKWQAGLLYLCQQLEKEWKDSCAIVRGNRIAWVVNLSVSQKGVENDEFFRSLSYLIRDYVCVAGVSDSFNDLAELKKYERQADIALDIGYKEQPHQWYFRFEDYKLKYMIGMVTREFSGKELCHRVVKILINYDEENNTEYAYTLYTFLISEYNITQAAEKVFVHRTTFVRRMERIKELTQVNLNDPDEILQILLSFKLLNFKLL